MSKTLYCKPIPLTPEILEKNGFQKTGQDNYTIYSSANDGYIKVEISDGIDGEWNLQIDNYDKFNNSHARFSIDKCFLKVHQLQLALRLCGINKKITL